MALPGGALRVCVGQPLSRPMTLLTRHAGGPQPVSPHGAVSRPRRGGRGQARVWHARCQARRCDDDVRQRPQVRIFCWQQSGGWHAATNVHGDNERRRLRNARCATRGKGGLRGVLNGGGSRKAPSPSYGRIADLDNAECACKLMHAQAHALVMEGSTHSVHCVCTKSFHSRKLRSRPVSSRFLRLRL